MKFWLLRYKLTQLFKSMFQEKAFVGQFYLYLVLPGYFLSMMPAMSQHCRAAPSSIWFPLVALDTRHPENEIEITGCNHTKYVMIEVAFTALHI